MTRTDLKKLKELYRRQDWSAAQAVIIATHPGSKITPLAALAKSALAGYQEELKKHAPAHPVLQVQVEDLLEPQTHAAVALSTVAPGLDKVYAQQPALAAHRASVLNTTDALAQGYTLKFDYGTSGHWRYFKSPAALIENVLVQHEAERGAER